MIKNLPVTWMILATLSLPLSISAHDKKLHKGKATEGEITSVSGDRFEMKTAAGTLSVAVSSKTKFEHGEEKVDKGHLKVGEHVSVFGTKVSKGEIAASSVLLGAASSENHGKMKGMDHGKMKGMDHGKMKDPKAAPQP